MLCHLVENLPSIFLTFRKKKKLKKAGMSLTFEDEVNLPELKQARRKGRRKPAHVESEA